jgi:hypothetical protein
VDNAVSVALQVQPSAGATVRNSQFLNSDTGIYVGGNFPLSVDSSCVLTGNDIGIHCYNTGTTSTIKRSTVSSNNDGMFCDFYSSPLIDANTMRYNGYAITCTNVSAPTIKNNVITSNANGIRTATGSVPDIGTSPSTGNNTIAYSTSYHVLNWDEGLTVSAQNNCWGKSTEPCGPKASKLLGYVDVDYPTCCTVSEQTSPAPQPEPAEPPAKTGLLAIVPNPFNPTTTVHYALASQGIVHIRIYDVAGRFVRELVNRTEAAGSHEAPWNGMDLNGDTVASGIYFVKLDVGRETFTKKMVLLK